jgi:hypothetical protein
LFTVAASGFRGCEERIQVPADPQEDSGGDETDDRYSGDE